VKHSHYFKPVPSGTTHLDVYAVLRMFDVADPCMQHAIKKLLCAGQRGAKDATKDVQEAIDTLARKQALDEEFAPVSEPAEKPWYPDDRHWIEVPDDCKDCPVNPDTCLYVMTRFSRKHKNPSPWYFVAGSELRWDFPVPHDNRIVAYTTEAPHAG
jgi:hypothetical protein